MIYLLFAIPQHLRLKKRYHNRVRKVRECLGTVRDFDNLISPQSLFLHFLGPKPSSKVRKNLKVMKKSKCVLHLFIFLFLFLFLFYLDLSFSKNNDQV